MSGHKWIPNFVASDPDLGVSIKETPKRLDSIWDQTLKNSGSVYDVILIPGSDATNTVLRHALINQ